MSEGLSSAASILTGAVAEPDAETQQSEPLPDQETDHSATDVEATETASGTDQAEVETPKALTVKQLAEKLDMTPQQLYAQLSLDMGGKSLTLSEVKDRAKELVMSDKKLADASAFVLQAENELLRKNRELELVQKRIGRAPTEQESQEAAYQHNQYVQKENAATIASISDWTDPAVQVADCRLIGETLTDYGFSPAEVGNTVDHRWVKLTRDFAVMRKRLQDVGTTEVKAVPNQQPQGKRRVQRPKQTALTAFKSGELGMNEAIISAIAEGSKP